MLTNVRQKFFLSALVTSIGNWLTFIAIALLIGEKYGASNVAFAFLIQSLPPILFSHRVSHWLKPFNKVHVFVVLEVIAAVNVLLLIYSQSLLHIYTYLFIATSIRTFNNPIFNAFVGEWIPKEEMQLAHTQIGGVSSFTLMLAPVAGGYIAANFGYELLFIIDALSFIFAIIFLLPFPKNSTVLGQKIKSSINQKKFFIAPKFNKELNCALYIWFWFLVAGALLNGLEFPVFFKAGLSKEDIGTVLGFWGGGSFAAIFAARLKRKISFKPLIMLFAVSMLGFVFAQKHIIFYLSFLLGGFANVLIAGKLKAQIQSHIGGEYEPLQVWSYVNQNVNLINVIIYGTMGILTATIPLSWLGVLLLFVVLALFLFKESQVERI